MDRVRVSIEKLRQILVRVKNVERSQGEVKILCCISLIVSLASLVLHAI